MCLEVLLIVSWYSTLWYSCDDQKRLFPGVLVQFVLTSFLLLFPWSTEHN